MKKIIFGLLLLSLFLANDVFSRRPYRVHRQRYHQRHRFPHHRKYRKRLYYRPHRYWPWYFTIATMSALSAKDREKETVIVVEREFTDKEQDLQDRIQKLERELEANKKRLKEIREKKGKLPVDLEKKLKQLEKLSIELKESLEDV